MDRVDEQADIDPSSSGGRGGWLALAWILILVGDVLAAWRGYVGGSLYRRSLQERLFDPPSAALYLRQAQTAGAIAVAGLLLAGLGMALLLREQRRL